MDPESLLERKRTIVMAMTSTARENRAILVCMRWIWPVKSDKGAALPIISSNPNVLIHRGKVHQIGFLLNEENFCLINRNAGRAGIRLDQLP